METNNKNYNDEMIYASRVNQLDAQSLDNELYSIIQSKLHNINIYPLNKIEPELEALVKSYLWWNTVKRSGNTIGQSILDLCFYHSHRSVNTKSLRRFQTYGIAFGHILFPWIKRRLSSLRFNRLNDSIEHFETVYNALDLINSLLFLYHGHYRSLMERCLKLKCGPTQPESGDFRQVQYEFMNRELLWHAFAEFLTFILPLINFYRMRNAINNLLRTYVWKTDPNAFSNVNDRTLDDLKRCGICNNWPMNAYQIGCRHVFCYYCIMSNFLSDQRNGFNCPLCLHRVERRDSIAKVNIIAF